MTAVSLLQEKLIAFFQTAGLTAMAAFPSTERYRWERPILVVSVKEFSLRESGLGSYLGERWNKDAQRMEEVYGQWVAIRFSLDLYGPRKGGEAKLSETLDRVCWLVSDGTALGCSVLEWKFGEIEYDRSCDMLKRQGSLLCEGLLYARRAEDGSFTDFEVKGGITLA